MPLRINNGQLLLFPKETRDLAESIGLDFWAAKKLYDDKWLSFDPETTNIKDNGMEAEFVFLGFLVAAGCEPRLLKRLLSKLEKPYCYDISKIYYDWTSQTWNDLPYQGAPLQIAEEIIADFENDEDQESLISLQETVKESVKRLADTDETDPDSADLYDFNPKKDIIIKAAHQLLWKIAESKLADSPAKTIVLGKLYSIFQKLPNVTLEAQLKVELVGPTRKYGEHEIYHCWDIELSEDGELSISSGGHFYRPETGGDSFSSMSWEIFPGNEPEFSDFLHTLTIVDDADSFENEVSNMDFSEGGYKLSVEDSTLEDSDDEGDCEDNEDEDDDDEAEDEDEDEDRILQSEIAQGYLNFLSSGGTESDELSQPASSEARMSPKYIITLKGSELDFDGSKSRYFQILEKNFTDLEEAKKYMERISKVMIDDGISSYPKNSISGISTDDEIRERVVQNLNVVHSINFYVRTDDGPQSTFERLYYSFYLIEIDESTPVTLALFDLANVYYGRPETKVYHKKTCDFWTHISM